MIYTDLPINNRTGWGAIGTYLLKELSKLNEIKLFRKDLFSLEDVFDHQFFKDKFADEEEIAAIMSGKLTKIDHTYLSYPLYSFPTFQPPKIALRGRKTIGIAVFEHNFVTPKDLEHFNTHYDSLITACKWCEDALRSVGYDRVTSIPHGIDPLVFNPSYSEKEFLKDKFVVFSGGKFEFRKGQDVVMRAYKVLQDKYDDVMMVASWYNPWPQSLNTMRISRLINFQSGGENYMDLMKKTLHNNGIDVNRVILPQYQSNYVMPRIYRNTDIGLFTNRCEAGTNIVLMEYMACGKPAIATYSSGNRDVIQDNNAILVKDIKPCAMDLGGRVIGNWDEPNLDEVVSQLEWAYHHRDEIRAIGKHAGDVMATKFSWQNIAEQFHKVINE